jgi:hypothetical protein
LAAFVIVCVLVAAYGGGGSSDVAAATKVRPFSEAQASGFAFEGDPLDPSRGIFRVETTEPMICAIVWGETEALGRFNNSLSMNGTGVVDHEVLLPGAVAGRSYHYIVQGTTADGTLYRSEPATFTIPRSGSGPTVEGPAIEVGANLALGATVLEVSSEFSDRVAGGLAIDGDLGSEWSSSGDGDNAWLTLDLGSSQRLVAVEFVTRSMADGSAVTSTFTVSVDGADPVGPFAAASPATSRPVALDVTGRVLRFDVEQSSGGNVGAVEIRVFAPPN